MFLSLLQLEETEQYYASSKMFRSDHPEVGEMFFQSRVKSLCMWYNLTRQLRSKIDVLGNVMLGLGATRYGFNRSVCMRVCLNPDIHQMRSLALVVRRKRPQSDL